MMKKLKKLIQIQIKETQIKIDWNTPIDALENVNRIQKIGLVLKNKVNVWEADAGLKQFILQQDNNSSQKAELYYKCVSAKQKKITDQIIDSWLKKNYPDASWQILAAPNAFTQLFVYTEH